jgi:hypothetical protein
MPPSFYDDTEMKAEAEDYNKNLIEQEAMSEQQQSHKVTRVHNPNRAHTVNVLKSTPSYRWAGRPQRLRT